MRDFARAQTRSRDFLVLIALISAFIATGCTTGAGVGLSVKAPDRDQAAKQAQDAQHDQQAAQILEGLDAIDGQLAANRKSVNRVMGTAFSQVGNTYRRGGTKPETGFDCSGFVGWVYGQYNVRLPRSSGDMMAALDNPVPRKDLRPGDLVFFGRKKRITHVGIYTGNNKYIHSPSSGKPVQESSLDDRGRGEYYAGARRVLNNEGVNAIDEALKSAWIAQTRRQLVAGKTFSDTVAAIKAIEAQETPGLHAAETPSAGLQAPGLQVIEAQPPMAASAGDRFTVASPVVEMAAAASSQVDFGDLGVGPVVEITETTSIIAIGAAAPVVAPAAAAPVADPKAAAAQITAAEAKPAVKTAAAVTPATTVQAEAKPAAAVKPAATAKVEAKPAAKAAPAKGADQKAAKAAAERSARKHKVASGDTLFALARKYGVTIDALAKANNMDKNKTALKLGQMLVVPPQTRTN